MAKRGIKSLMTELMSWLAMGGHGFYIWLAYGVGLGTMIIFVRWIHRTYQYEWRSARQREDRMARSVESVTATEFAGKAGKAKKES